jgi:copper chaperone CopZ
METDVEEKIEEVSGIEEVEGETEKIEEEIKEDEISDEDGLFTSEFDNLMDPNGIGFGENMDWMNDV